MSLPAPADGDLAAAVRSSLVRARDGHGGLLLLPSSKGRAGRDALVAATSVAEELGFVVRTTRGRAGTVAPFSTLAPLFHSETSEAIWRQLRAGAESDLPLEEATRPWLAELPSTSAGLPEALANRRGRGILVLTRAEGNDRGGTRPRSPPTAPPVVRRRWGRDVGGEVWPANDLESLRSRLLEHLRRSPGDDVLIQGLEYVGRENSFPPVLRLVRELGERCGSEGGRCWASFLRGSLAPGDEADLRTLGRCVGAMDLAASERSPIPPDPAAWPEVVLALLDHWARGSQARPLLLVVEHIDESDPASLRALCRLAVSLGRQRLAVLATARSSDRELAERPQGQAFRDLLRTVRREEGLADLRDTRGPAAPSPPISGLEAGALDLLRWCSVAGQEVPEEALSAAADMEEERVARTARSLAQEGWLEPTLEAGSWALGLGELPVDAVEGRRRALRLAGWWARTPDADVFQVAALYHRAVAPAEGIAWARKALDRAFELRSPDGFEEAHRWLLDLLGAEGSPADRRLREGLRVVQRFQARLGPSDAIDHALGLLRAVPAAANLRAEVDAWRLWNHLSLDPAAVRSEASWSVGGSSPALETEVSEPHALLTICQAYRRLLEGAPDDALAMTERALGAPALRDSRFLEGTARWCRAWALLAMGRTSPAREEAERVHELAVAMDDLEMDARALGLLASILGGAGDLQGARAATLEALSRFELGCDVASRLTALTNLAMLEEELGRPQEAERRRQEAERLRVLVQPL